MPVIPPPGSPGGDQSIQPKCGGAACLTVFAATSYIALVPARCIGMAG